MPHTCVSALGHHWFRCSAIGRSLPGTLSNYCQLDPQEWTSLKFDQIVKSFHHLKMPAAKWKPFFFGFSVLTTPELYSIHASWDSLFDFSSLASKCTEAARLSSWTVELGFGCQTDNSADDRPVKIQCSAKKSTSDPVASRLNNVFLIAYLRSHLVFFNYVE